MALRVATENRHETCAFNSFGRDIQPTTIFQVVLLFLLDLCTLGLKAPLKVRDVADVAMFLKWASSMQQLVGDHRQGPVVSFWAVDVLLTEHLWRQILLGAAGESAGKCTTEPSAVLCSMNVCDTEVCEMGPATFVKNDVL